MVSFCGQQDGEALVIQILRAQVQQRNFPQHFHVAIGAVAQESGDGPRVPTRARQVEGSVSALVHVVLEKVRAGDDVFQFLFVEEDDGVQGAQDDLMLLQIPTVGRFQRRAECAFPRPRLGVNPGPVLKGLVVRRIVVGDREGVDFHWGHDLEALAAGSALGVVDAEEGRGVHDEGRGGRDGRQPQFGQHQIDDALHDHEGIQGGAVLRNHDRRIILQQLRYLARALRALEDQDDGGIGVHEQRAAFVPRAPKPIFRSFECGRYALETAGLSWPSHHLSWCVKN